MRIDADRLEEELRKLIYIYNDEYGRGFNDGIRMVLAVLINMKEEQK